MPVIPPAAAEYSEERTQGSLIVTLVELEAQEARLRLRKIVAKRASNFFM
jgi:hypothetical protein